jgi:glycosyltransferase involved in cell wall biosynthesis
MAKKTPKISIVTPSYNQGKYIEETILSVIGQNYPNLEYIIVDGGSTDNSVEIIKKYEKHLTYWVSEPDNGMYEAIQKGFEKSSGEIMGWINSDDMLHKKSLFTLCEIFSSFPQIKWLQGLNTVFDESGRVVLSSPPKLTSRYNFYLKEYNQLFGFIQQESTYWRRNLWQEAGSYITKDCKYAGDYDLWMRFFRYTPLYITQALIGGFRVRTKGQLSRDNYKSYLLEVDEITAREISLLNQKQRQNMNFVKIYQKYIDKIPKLRTILSKKYHNSLEKAPQSLLFNPTKQSFELA